MFGTSAIGILSIAFREARFIGPCIRQFEPFGLYHLVLVSVTPWNGDWPKDDTLPIAARTNADVRAGFWTSEAEQRNYGLTLMRERGIEWALIVDADEFYTFIGIEALLQSLHTPASVVTAPRMLVYWKTPEYRISNSQNDNPIVAIRTDQAFTKMRMSSASVRSKSDAELHHLSYVRDDIEILAKMAGSEHQHEFRANWLEDVWGKWIPEMKQLHPVIPPLFHQAIYDPIADEIGQWLA